MYRHVGAREKSPVHPRPARRSSPNLPPNNNELPCTFGGELGCENNRKKDSLFCPAHDRIVTKWGGKKDAEVKKRKQDLRRWAAFHEYT